MSLGIIDIRNICRRKKCHRNKCHLGINAVQSFKTHDLIKMCVYQSEGSLKIVIQKISFVTWQEINCQKKNRPPARARTLRSTSK